MSNGKQLALADAARDIRGPTAAVCYSSVRLLLAAAH